MYLYECMYVCVSAYSGLHAYQAYVVYVYMCVCVCVC